MGIIKKVELKNFECFRDTIKIDLEDATFFIGENNSGKSAVLRGICVFFGNVPFGLQHINKTQFRSKQKGSNVSEITIFFDLNQVKGKKLKERLMKLNSRRDILQITRKFKYHDPGHTDKYSTFGREVVFYDLDKDVQKLINSVEINYIHPQEGTQLLSVAQDKLRRRLLDNWGRTKVVSTEYDLLQKEWVKFTVLANNYLSDILSTQVKKFWGEKAEVMVELPAKVQDLINVGAISFQSDPKLPEIPLTMQGTGVQQSLLYYASYVLDSDMTIKRNSERYPVWLLEEPESFLHANMIIKLAKDLTSVEWLGNLQILTTTHSGLLLSSAINKETKALWNVISAHALKQSFSPTNIDENKLHEISVIMGDPNFDVSFYSSFFRVFNEDLSEVLTARLKEVGIPSKGLGGSSEIVRYIKAFDAAGTGDLGKIVQARFVVDGDKGFKDIAKLLNDSPEKQVSGFRRYSTKSGISKVIVLPSAAEDLFSEFSEFVNECAHEICDEHLVLKSSCSGEFTQVYANLKRQFTASKPLDSWKIIEVELKKDDNVKRIFWKKVRDENLKIDSEQAKILLDLLE